MSKLDKIALHNKIVIMQCAVIDADNDSDGMDWIRRHLDACGLYPDLEKYTDGESFFKKTYANPDAI